MKYLTTIIGLLSLLALFLESSQSVIQSQSSVQSNGLDPKSYLPIIIEPQPTQTPSPTPTPEPSPTPGGNMALRNHSFEDGWTDLPPAPGYLINQQPNDWVLNWIEPGRFLYDSTSDKAGGVPECIHKHANQLPPNEQPGGQNALILDGEYVFKIFHFGAPFGAELTQEISNLPPGSTWRLTVPIQVHLHGETDPYAAESSVWVNGEGGWANGFVMGDREWYNHVVVFVVPNDGNVLISIRVKSKWYNPKDFFIDYIQMERVS